MISKIHYKIAFIFIAIIASLLIGSYSYLTDNIKKHTDACIEASLSKNTLLARSFLESKYYPGLSSAELDAIADLKPLPVSGKRLPGKPVV